MKKFILKWLFGEDFKDYMELLHNHIEALKKHSKTIDDHIATLHREAEDLEIIRKLIVVCENHGIDVDKEIEQIHD